MKEEKLVLLKILKLLDSGSVPLPNEGICKNVYCQTIKIYGAKEFTCHKRVNKLLCSVMKEATLDWENFSGSSCYPVKSPYKEKDLTQYNRFEEDKRCFQDRKNMWENEYGNRRKELLVRMLKVLQ
jgi:hypothetical protein